MRFDTLASEDTLTKIVPALAERGITAEVVDTGAAALERIKALIPAGVSVMNGASRTLEQIGYVSYLESGAHPWKNLKADILAEQDPVKQAELRKQSVISDWYLGSVHALSEDGQLVIASNSGSQLPHIAFTSQNLIFVVSTMKITPTLTDALQRLDEHVIPLEDERMMGAMQMHTQLSKLLIWKDEPRFMGRGVHMLLVKEDLGF